MSEPSELTEKHKRRLETLKKLEGWSAEDLLNYLDGRDQYEMVDTIMELLQEDDER